MENGSNAKESGSLTISYVDLGNGPRRLTIYLPAGWPDVRPEAVLYYLHGAGYDDTSLLGREGMETNFKQECDKAIANRDIPPTTIVCPHYSDATTVVYAVGTVARAADTLRKLVSYVEPTFLCRVDRNHRGIAGFSMGGAMVWEALASSGDLFSTYVPIGSDCWLLGYEGGRHDPRGTASLLTRRMSEFGKTCTIKAWCGELDPCAPWAERQVDEMNKQGIEHVTFCIVKGVGHATSSVRPAILDCLRSLGM